MAGVLLDTHAALWLMNGDKLSRDALTTIETASKSDELFVSPITAWEIATLVRKGRIALNLPPDSWFQRMLSAGVMLADMSPDLLVASVFLPGNPPNDPADRIIVATARAESVTLITRDEELLRYGNRGHARVLQC